MNGARPRRRVALVGERADFYGGGQKSLLDLALALRGAPVEPVVIVPGAGPLTSALEEGGVECVCLPLPAIRRRGGSRSLRTLGLLAATVRDRDLALLHSDSPRSAFYSGLAARLLRRPHVWHVRASIPSSGLSDRLLLGLSDVVVSVSRASAARSRALRSSNKVRVVPTGIPAIDLLDRDAARDALGLPRQPLIAGVVGRVERDKGGDDAVSALVGIREAAPGALLVFLGAIDEENSWVHTCRLRAAGVGLSSAVRFLGDRPEAARHFKAFDLILHPSRHEALPRVLIEALQAGVPAVAYAVGGVPEVIEPGGCGLLVTPRSVEALREAAARLAGDPALRRRLAAGGLERARRLFSLEGMVRAVTAVYDELLGTAKRRAEPIGKEAAW